MFKNPLEKMTDLELRQRRATLMLAFQYSDNDSDSKETFEILAIEGEQLGREAMVTALAVAEEMMEGVEGMREQLMGNLSTAVKNCNPDALQIAGAQLVTYEMIVGAYRKLTAEMRAKVERMAEEKAMKEAEESEDD